MDNFERDGYTVVRSVVDAATIAAAHVHLATLHGDALRTAAIEHEPFFAEVVALPALIAVATAALGGPVEPFACTYIVKPARAGVRTLWHQDGHPWEARGIRRAVSIGIALDRSTPDNGCLLVLPGSHRLDAQPLHPVTHPPNVFGAEIAPSFVDESMAVPVPLEPGDASVHHPNLIHGADANRSDSPRTTLVVRYRA